MSVQSSGNFHSDESNIERLPFASRLAVVRGRHDAGVECAGAVQTRRATEIVGDLHFIAAAQPNAAVAALSDVVFDVQFEVPILVLGDQIVGVAGAFEYAIFNGPTSGCGGFQASPARKILSIEERDRFTFTQVASSCSSFTGAAVSGELQVALRSGHLAFEDAIDVVDYVIQVIAFVDP